MKTLFYFLLPVGSLAFWFQIANINRTSNISKKPTAAISLMAAPSIDLVNVWPENKTGDVVYLTSGPKSSAGSISALLSVKFKIANKEGKTITLKKIEYQCSGNSNNKIFSFSPNSDNSNESIAASKSFSWQNSRTYHELGNVIELPFPFPSQLTIKLYFDGYTSPYTITKSLKPYINEAVYSFPAKQKDLGYGEYWFADASHGGGSQVFSYDIIIKGWDAETKKWSSKYPGKDGTKNEHYRCFGRPVYAIADGEVVHFNDKIKDNEPGVDTDGGGNTFHIKVGNTVIRYYHLKQFSLNKNLMKEGAKVKRGDFLARVGSTATAGTHLHIDCVPADDTEPVIVFPFQFSDAYIVAQNNMNEPDPNAKWTKLNKTGLPYIANGGCYIWPGDKPTWYPGGWGEIGRHGIPEKNYQEEFNKIWSSGYYPEWVDAYDVNGKTYFNAIFRYNDKGYKIVARHDMTPAQYQDEYNNWVKKNGYRLQQIDNYNDNGKLKIAAIFIKKPGQPGQQPAYHAASPEDHQKMFEDYGSKGFVPVNVSVTSMNGKRYYSAFYEKRNVGKAVLKSFLTQEEYQDLFDDMKKKSYEQVYINAYHHDGKTRFSAIWYQNAGYKSYSATRKSSSDSYQNQYDNNLEKSLLTQFVTGYEEGNKPWFAALWAK